MSGLLEGQVVFVVGGASGIGRAAALGAAREGAKVVVVDRDEAGAAAVAEQLESQGQQALSVAADVTDSAALERAVEQAVQRFERIDVAVNSAGITTAGGAFHEASETDFDRLSAVIAGGMFASMRAELRQLLRQESAGAIVNVAGAGGLVGLPGFALESACTHAVIGLTKTAALEFAAAGIRVNAVCPASIETDLLQASLARTTARSAPMQRRGSPDEVAEAIIWLACSRSSFVTGEALQIDGGTVEAEGQLHAG